MVNWFLHLFFNGEAHMYTHNTAIYAGRGDIHIVLLCSGSQEDLMEN